MLDALALSGLATDRFCYEGFLPRRHNERLKALRALRAETRTIVFYEAPHRIRESMDDFFSVFGPGRSMALARELTKDYEEVRRGTIAQIRQTVTDDPPRGEIVLVIAGASAEEAEAAGQVSPAASAEDIAREAVRYSEMHNVKVKDAIVRIVQEHPLPDGSLPNRKKVYAAVLALKDVGAEDTGPEGIKGA